MYDPAAETKVSADASSFGLGAVMLQKAGNEWRPVAYASRSMTDTERRYAQIEKEALAVTWACEKFRNYLLGRQFHIESDHKPLIPLLNSKHLDTLPPRVLRFRLRMATFDYTVQHVPGKLLYTADTLSRAPNSESGEGCLLLQKEVETFISSVTSTLPASKLRLEEYRKCQGQDSVCSKVREYCQIGWPKKHLPHPTLSPYWAVRGFLTLDNELLLYGNRIVVPSALQKDTIEKIHFGHQGIERCQQRVRSSVWWPGVSAQIKQKVLQCQECTKSRRVKREPLMSTPLPDYPWQVVATDLFELNGDKYVLVVDYFSRFPEVIKLSFTTSAVVIAAFKSLFSRFGIPEVVRSDNGPQFSSLDFAKFADLYGFQHLTSSPRYPQSNRLAERTIQTV